MIVRVWQATILPGRQSDYDTFAREMSQPMFEQQAGFQGVLFSREAGRCLVITFWRDHKSTEALATSPTYRRTVERISALIHPQTTTHVYQLSGGILPRSETIWSWSTADHGPIPASSRSSEGET